MSSRFRSADLFQCLPLRFQIGPGVVIGGVEAHMTKPAADDGNVDARRDEVYGGGGRKLCGVTCLVRNVGVVLAAAFT